MISVENKKKIKTCNKHSLSLKKATEKNTGVKHIPEKVTLNKFKNF